MTEVVRHVTTAALPGILGDLVALDAELFGVEAWDTAAWSDLLTTPGRRLTVVEEPGLRAYALTGVVGDFVDLLRIGVAPTARRRGLAGVLLADAVDAARTEGADRMLLEVSEANAGACAFYDQAGFIRIDRRPGYYRDGHAALVLQINLGVDRTPADAHPQGRMDP